MATFELTTEGLETPTLAEARAFVVDLWKDKHGENVNTSSDTPDGLIIDCLAIVMSTLWDGSADVYSAGYFRTASGTALDLILDLFGKTRLPALASTASLVWYGTPSTVLPAASIASVNDIDESRFSSDLAGAIGADDSSEVYVVRILSAVDTETHTITIGATPYNYVNTGVDTVDSVAVQLRDLINLGSQATATLGGNDSSGNALIVVDSDIGLVALTTSETTAGLLDEFEAGRTAATATETGAITGVAGTIQTIVTPITGVTGVTNSADATVGRDQESDVDYRARHLQTLNADGCGTPQAIRDAILENVTAATQCRVFENESDVTDGAGRPPHSFEAVVLSDNDTADDADIAEQIAACKPAGIKAHGDAFVAVTDPQGGGGTVSIGVSHPTKRYLHLDITVTAGEGFPTTGDPATAIQTEVALYLGPTGDGYLNMADDLYRYQLGKPINDAVPGVANAVIDTDDTPNPGDTPTFTAADITVADDEILISDASRITVTIV